MHGNERDAPKPAFPPPAGPTGLDIGLVSLAETFVLPPDRIRRDLVASRAINWGNDPFARGAYSYATPKTRQALAVLRKPGNDSILFSGEALYAGPRHGDCRGGVGQRPRDGANDPERI